MPIALLYLAFFVSGAAALAYESVWTRYLGLLVGHDAYAQVVVLLIFLGGMSLGALAIARRSAGIRQPLLWYAIIEAVVGVLALLFHDVFAGVSGLAYDTLFPALANGPLVGPAKWFLAAVLILPQSVLLGTTFPLMSARILRLAPTHPGRILAWLYFTNSLGGSVGVLLAGFVLVEAAGLPGTLAAAGGMNLVVALIALAAAKLGGERRDVDTDHTPVQPGPSIPHPNPASARAPSSLLLGVAFGTAVASFAYEIDWIRMLSLVLGSATHSFELMLSAFILGLAIGALLVRRLDALSRPLVVLGWIQVAMGLAAVMTLPVYMMSFDWMATLLQTFTRTEQGYAGFSLVRYAICLVVMLPATICAGMTLPLITRTLLTSGHGESAIGRVYAWNTFGSIVGVALAALVLLPALGLKPMLLAAGALDIALGLLLFAHLGETRRAAAAALLSTAVLGAVALRVPLERQVVTSGVYRRGVVQRTGLTLPFYADGRTATVSVGETPSGDRWISTNGKADASIGAWWDLACADLEDRRRLGGDEITQVLLPIVVHAYAPDARRAAIIGFGSGMSSHILLAQPRLEELTTIEIEPEMIAGSRLFAPANARVYDDPRSRIVQRDAKAHFAATDTRWDLILSEPSNPWVSGVSGLFTIEFYERVRTALAPGGVFGQWLHTYELDDALVFSVLAAIDRVFPNWVIHQVGGGDLLVVATTAEALPPLQADRILASTELHQDLCRFVPVGIAEIAATLVSTPALFRPALRRVGQPNSDFYPMLDLGAERSRFLQSTATGMMSLGYEWLNLAGALTDDRRVVSLSGELALQDATIPREAWIRDRVDATSIEDEPLLQEPRRRVLLWRALQGATARPIDWREWLDAHLAALQVHHAGMAGVIDTAFFDAADAAARRFDAPAAVIATLGFRRAVQGWDAVAALQSAAAVQADGNPSAWLDPDELRDGAVVMALRHGDVGLAHQWYAALAATSTRGATDLRSLLLSGWLPPAPPAP